MPPPNAVAGKYVGPRGEKIQVAPLSDEDRRTLVRWIDLGCPINFGDGGATPYGIASRSIIEARIRISSRNRFASPMGSSRPTSSLTKSTCPPRS